MKANEVRAGDRVGKGGAAKVLSVGTSPGGINIRFETDLGVVYARPYAEVEAYREDDEP